MGNPDMAFPSHHRGVFAAASRQTGVSLLELMVGVIIGLMVVLAAMGTLITSRQSSTTVAESYRVSTAGNLALRLIGASVRQAGAAELDQPSGQNTPVMFADFTQRADAADAAQIVSGTEGGTSTPDTLVVTYQHRGANVTRDCLGAAPTSNLVRIQNTFSVSTVELRCTGSVNTSAPQALVGDNSQQTTEVAVEDFQVWYWVTNAAGTQQRRFTATDVPANGGWGFVVAVEVCLQLRGIRTDFPTSGTFANCQGTTTTADGRLHQLFRNTFVLRNRLG